MFSFFEKTVQIYNISLLQYSNRTWIYHIVTDTWRSGPSLNTGRKNHACITIKDNDEKITSVLISGGYDNAYKTHGYLKSTEILENIEGFWKFGPDLIMGSSEATLIDTFSTTHIALLMGGYVSWGSIDDASKWKASSAIFGLNRLSNQWERLGNLTEKRNMATAVHVSFDFMKGCN